MFILALLFPFLGFVIATILGRWSGKKGAAYMSCLFMLLTNIIAIFIWYYVFLGKSEVSIYLLDWISLDFLSLALNLHFDSLTANMMVVVTTISALVHIYSVSYMSEDPHLPRFMGLLSLFTFFMIWLITSDSLIQLFVGWEGINICLKWLYDTLIYTIAEQDYSKVSPRILYTWLIGIVKYGCNCSEFEPDTPDTPDTLFAYDYSQSQLVNICIGPWIWHTKNSLKRIGPHNEDIISLIIGSTLGDSHLEKRKSGKGTRVIFEQCSKNVEYLMKFHKILSISGYCRIEKPILKKRISIGNNVLFFYRINSYTFNSFNWIHNLLYKQNLTNEGKEKYIKYINPLIINYITPMTLAYWFMDDGSKTKKGCRIATCAFSKSDVCVLSDLINEKYGLATSVQIAKTNKTKKHVYYQIYIPVKSIKRFNAIIDSHMVLSMKYKLN